MTTQGRQPGESDRDYIRRLARQSEAQRQQRKDEARQESADATAEEAAIREAMGDEVWLDEFSRTQLGMSYGDVERTIQWGTENQGKIAGRDQAAIEAYKKAQGAYGKKRRNRKVAKALKRNKKSIQNMDKKRNKGCAVIAVALLGVGGGALWGLYEAGSAIVTAMAR